MQSNRHCRVCGKIITSHYAAKCCSDECRDIYYQSLLKPINSHICEICKCTFKSTKQLQRYCSVKCRREGMKLQAQKRKELNIKYYYPKLLIRFQILARDGFKCRYCGRSASEDNVKLHVDHILNKNNGGDDDPSNLITACQDCNIGKGKQMLVTNTGQIPTYLMITTIKPKHVP